MKYVRAAIFVAAFLLPSLASAQWQVPVSTIPYGRGAGATGFGSVPNTGTGTLCLLNTAPPSFGACPVGTLTVGTTPIAAGTSLGLLYNNAGKLGNTNAGASGWILSNNGTVPAYLSNLILVPARCDGSTDDTAAIAAAIAAAPAAGANWVTPPGTCIVSTVTINKPGIFGGAGMSGGFATNSSTIIKGSSSSLPVISITAANGGVRLQDLAVTSAIASASRTGAGVEINAGSNVLIERVYSQGHLYGFWNKSPGVDFESSVAVLNASHGFLLDGTFNNQDEIRLNNSRADSNSGDGLRINGRATGVIAYSFKSVGNAGNGIKLLQPGGSATRVADIYFTDINLSENTGCGLDNGSNPDGTSLSITGGLIESSTCANGQVWIGQGFIDTKIQGVTFGDAPTIATFFNGAGLTYTGNIIKNNFVGAVELGPLSTGANLANNRVNSLGGGTTAVGLFIDSGAAIFSAVNNDWSGATTPRVGTIPPGSCYLNNRGDIGNSFVCSPLEVKGNLILDGSASGALTIKPPAAAGTNTLTLPAGTTDFSATGGTSQVVKQTSAGGALTVARLACADLSNAAAGCSATPAALTKTDDTNVTITLGGTPATALLQAASITVGWTATLSVARGGTGIGSGTSGGIPYFSASGTIASSAALAANSLVIGGGAGAAPSTTATGSGVLTAIGNTLNAASGLVGFSGNLGTATFTGLQNGTGAASGNNVIAVNIGSATNRFISVQNSAGEALYGIDTAGNAYAYLNSGTGGTFFGTGTAADTSFVTNGLVRFVVKKSATHIAGNGTAPALTSCGTSPIITGNDIHGAVVMGTGAPTGCVITFNAVYGAAPSCVVTWRATPLASQSYAISTSAITLTQTGTSSNVVDYHCMGQ